MKHIGMDAHSTTTTLTVLNSRGREIAHTRIPTRDAALVDFFESIPGQKRVALEESPVADWVTRVIQPHVSEVIRCLPQHNRLISESEKKCDREDSRSLANLLFLNRLKPVHHPAEIYRDLREGVRSYWKASSELTRARNRLKAFFAFNGIQCQDEQVYLVRSRKEYGEKLAKRGGNSDLLKLLYLQLDRMVESKAMHLRLLRELGKPVRESIQLLQTIPAIGEIGAHTLAAYLENGWRIPNKRKLWQYCGIGLRQHQSDGTGYQAASLNGNRLLKNTLMTAASCIIAMGHDRNALCRLLRRDEATGVPIARSRRNLARKTAVIAQHVLRYEEEYDDAKVIAVVST